MGGSATSTGSLHSAGMGIVVRLCAASGLFCMPLLVHLSAEYRASGLAKWAGKVVGQWTRQSILLTRPEFAEECSSMMESRAFERDPTVSRLGLAVKVALSRLWSSPALLRITMLRSCNVCRRRCSPTAGSTGGEDQNSVGGSEEM